MLCYVLQKYWRDGNQSKLFIGRVEIPSFTLMLSALPPTSLWKVMDISCLSSQMLKPNISVFIFGSVLWFMCINPPDLFHTGISRCDILLCSRLQTHNKTLTTLHLQCCNCLSSLDGFYLSLSLKCVKKKLLLKLAFCIIAPFLHLLLLLFHLFACKFFVKYA